MSIKKVGHLSPGCVREPCRAALPDLFNPMYIPVSEGLGLSVTKRSMRHSYANPYCVFLCSSCYGYVTDDPKTLYCEITTIMLTEGHNGDSLSQLTMSRALAERLKG